MNEGGASEHRPSLAQGNAAECSHAGLKKLLRSQGPRTVLCCELHFALRMQRSRINYWLDHSMGSKTFPTRFIKREVARWPHERQ